jgi:hypothetical protein
VHCHIGNPAAVAANVRTGPNFGAGGVYQVLVGAHQLNCLELNAAVGRVKALGEDDGLARIVFRQTGVGDAGLALQPLPADAGNAGVHGLPHFFVNLGHTMVFALVVPGQTQSLGHLLHDPEVGARIAGGG